ncbi:MAG: putative metal-binding motif-containing protein [Chitinophagales bacterium]|nr:putative metal-binding motif-containing protein [Chitinophagales bacterium]MDW8428020.1 putative metal-binding motif-containing protein [Chitinophagales bacterium]
MHAVNSHSRGLAIAYSAATTVIFLLHVKFLAAQQPPIIQWQYSLGGSKQDEIRGGAVCPDGGFIVVGSSQSSDYDIPANKGGTDYMIARFSANGTLKWVKTYGGTRGETARCVEPTIDGGFVVGGYSQSQNNDVGSHNGYFDIWILKLDSSGNILMKKTYGGSGFDNCYRIIPSGNYYYLTGFTESMDGLGAGNHGGRDIVVAKIDAVGTVVWKKVFGGSLNEEASCILETSSGNLLVVGYAQSTDGDLTLSHGMSDYWILMLDTLGNLIWQKTFGGNLDDAARWVIEPEPNRFVICGVSSSTEGQKSQALGVNDFWIIKIDHQGNLIWETSVGGLSYDYAYHISKTFDGKYLVSGQTYSSNGTMVDYRGAGDFGIALLDTNGAVIWGKAMGGSKLDEARWAQQINAESIIIAGFSNSFDHDVAVNKGSLDGWITRACLNPLAYFPDQDGDGFGNPNLPLVSCAPPSGYVVANSDCNDNDAAIHPFASEWCDGLDNDCNGILDDVSLTTEIEVDGSTTFCSDQSRTLTLSNTYNFSSCQWYVDDQPLPGSNNFELTISASGTYHAVLSNEFCQLSSNHVTLQALPIPSAVIQQNSPINSCEGKKVTLQAISCTGCSYQWLKDGVEISGATAASYTYQDDISASFAVRVTAENGCSATSPAVSVLKHPKPEAVITPQGSLDICFQGSVLLQASQAPGNKYKWYKDNVKISGATQNSYLVTAVGSYKVKITSSAKCSKTSEPVVVFSSCRSSFTSPPEVWLYPNPSDGRCQVVFADTNHPLVLEARILNATGKIVAHLMLQPTADGHFELTFPESLSDGLYVVLLGTSEYCLAYPHMLLR